MARAAGPALVATGLTLVIYMGVSRCQDIQASLLQAGMPASMPCAVISHASTPQQRHAYTPLGALAQTVMHAQLASPAIMVIGHVVAGACAFD